MTTRTSSRRRSAATSVAQPEAAASEQVTLTTKELIAKFLDGEEGKSEDFSSLGGALYERSTIVARRALDGSVLLGSNSIDNVSVNDQLMGQIFTRQRNFRRIPNFSTLTDPKRRTEELKSGRYDDFRAIANLFGLEVSDEDIAAVERAKEFNKRVTGFFDTIQSIEKARIKAAREAEKRALADAAAASWDNGQGEAADYRITGAGGGQRLRLAPGRAGSRRIQTSAGRELSYAAAKQSFDFASQFWHGGRRITRNNSTSARTRGSYHTTVTASNLHYGCQHVTREEAERFADKMGWARAQSSEAPASTPEVAEVA